MFETRGQSEHSRTIRAQFRGPEKREVRGSTPRWPNTWKSLRFASTPRWPNTWKSLRFASTPRWPTHEVQDCPVGALAANGLFVCRAIVEGSAGRRAIQLSHLLVPVPRDRPSLSGFPLRSVRANPGIRPRLAAAHASERTSWDYPDTSCPSGWGHP